MIASAVAAGVTTSANSSSVPTTCTAIVMARASSTMNATPSRRTGTPFASATCGSTDAKSSGRATTPRATASPTVKKVKVRIWSVEIASRLPNRTLVIVLVFSEASEAKSTPSPVAMASTVPVETSRFATRLPSAPIASPPLTQKIASPSVTGIPTSTANVAPGKPMWASAWAAKASRRITTK